MRLAAIETTLCAFLILAGSACGGDAETNDDDDVAVADESDDDDDMTEEGRQTAGPITAAHDDQQPLGPRTPFGDPWFDHEPTDCGVSEPVTTAEGFVVEENGLRRELVDGGLSGGDVVFSSIVVDQDGRPTVWANKGGTLVRYTVHPSFVEVTTFAGHVSGVPAATVDEDGRTHLVYADNRARFLFHLELREGDWIRTPIDCDARFYALDITSDFLGSIHVSYRHRIDVDSGSYEDRRFHAVRREGTWRRFQFDEGDTYTTFLRVDERLRVGIMTQTYYYTTFHLRDGGGVWTHDVLAMGGGDSTNPHETYSYNYIRPQFEFNDRDEIDWVAMVSEFWTYWPGFYGVNTIGYHTTDDVPFGSELDRGFLLEIGYPAFRETSDRAPHVFFRSGLMLKHHIRDDDWRVETIAVGGDYPSLFIDTDDGLYVSHYSMLETTLKATFRTNRRWRTRRLDRVTLAADSANALIDPNGDPVILHASDWPPGLIVDRPTGDVWQHETAFAAVNRTPTEDGVAMDDNGRIHILFSNPATLDMEYLSDAGGTWIVETATLGSGKCSLAVDGSMRVHAACAINGELRYLLRDNVGWTEEVIDVAALGFSYPSDPRIDVAPSGDAMILFYGYRRPPERFEMWVLENGSGSWQGTAVSAPLDAISHSMDIDIGPAGEVRAVVSDSDELRLYSRDGGTWSPVVSLVAPDGSDVVSDVSIAVDDSGANHVIYCESCGDNGGGPLRYATDASGTWTDSELESSYGGSAGIAIGDDDLIRVALTRGGSVFLTTFPKGWTD